MQSFISAIMTCKRPDDTSYLDGTIASLESAGIAISGICPDGPFPRHIHPASKGVLRTGIRLGIVPSFRLVAAQWQAVTRGIGNVHSSPMLAVFQDDVESPPNLRDIIENHLPSKRGVFSLYLTEGREAPQGWSTIDKSDTYPLNVGACGIVMDAETARLFIESPPFPRVDRLGSQLVLWCWERGIPFWQHSPSLLKHIGKVSCRQ